MHGCFRGGAGLINEQRALRPQSGFVIFTPFTRIHPGPNPPIPPRVKSVLAGLAIKFQLYERGHSFKKDIYHQPSPEDRFGLLFFWGWRAGGVGMQQQRDSKHRN